MLRNYILTALRNLSRHKIYAIINIAGLSVGLALTILLLSFIRYELSYEDFNPKKERIYRSISKIQVSEDKAVQGPFMNGFAHDWAINDIPEVKSALRLDPRPGELRYQGQMYSEFNGFLTDTNFFEFFNLPLKYGNKETALKPGSVILTEDLANVVFNRENPVGEAIEWRGYNLEVSAVLENLPKNTHLDIDLLAPLSLVKDMESYYQSRGFSVYTYYMFKKGMNTPSNIEKLAKHIETKGNEKYEKMGMEVDHRIQNLEDIHLHSSDLQFSMKTPGSMNMIYILSALAFFIVLIAVINYINLETSRAETRSLEVGIRKVSGAHRKNLIGQFIGESLITALISFLVAIGLAELFSGGFENLVNREFSYELYSPLNIAIYFGLALFIGLVAGFYPAIYLSSYRPAIILKSGSRTGKGNSSLRVVLVVTQFAIASFLIIGLLMVYNQIQYAKNKDLGFDQKQVLVVKGLTNAMEEDYGLIKNELSTIPSIKEISAATGYPGNASMHNLLRKNKNEKGVLAKDNVVKNGYDKTLGLKIKEGRYFSEEFKNDSNAYVINETAAEMLGIKNPVGKTIYHNQQKARIIGVMKDYHLESIREEIMPVMHSKRFDGFSYILLKIHRDNLKETLNSIEKRLTSIDNEYVFKYQFLDDYFDAMYKQEERLNKTSIYSAIIAIFIALLGLYALTSFVVIKRRQEIGIRKAMGATVGGIVFRLIKDINKWVLLANVIAWPLALYFMRQWLANFAFKIDISVWYFVAGTLISIVFSLIVVVSQAYNAATENPAHTLRDE
jgi:putative ABC transport system permease protein